MGGLDKGIWNVLRRGALPEAVTNAAITMAESVALSD
jgi:hypothetical protein